MYARTCLYTNIRDTTYPFITLYEILASREIFIYVHIDIKKYTHSFNILLYY